jgi:hypothetical protein
MDAEFARDLRDRLLPLGRFKRHFCLEGRVVRLPHTRKHTIPPFEIWQAQNPLIPPVQFLGSSSFGDGDRGRGFDGSGSNSATSEFSTNPGDSSGCCCGRHRRQSREASRVFLSESDDGRAVDARLLAGGVSKFVAIGTICAYPKFAPIPFKEENLWDGYPEEPNAPYGLAKKMLLVQAQAYRQQYGWNSIYLLPVNLYGPGDNFNPTRSHVIPALIKKFVEAKESGVDHVTAWGDGSPTREFLYVDDAAEGILLAAEHYSKPEPVNLGSGIRISIKDLTLIIARLVGYHGEIRWDTTQPNDQPRRCLDVSRADNEFGFRAQMGFDGGLQRMVEWYRHEHDKNRI